MAEKPFLITCKNDAKCSISTGLAAVALAILRSWS